MNRILFCLFFILQVFNQAISYGQLPDGVIATPGYISVINKNYNDEISIPFDLQSINSSIKIPIRVNVVKNITGSDGLFLTDIKNSLIVANSYFKSIGIQFFIDSIQYINDYNYSFVTYNHNLTEMLNKFAMSGKINLFLVDSIKLGNIKSYGFTYFPDEPDSNYIFISKNYLTGNSLATMLGHFMGLLSTHEKAGGAELANEINCATSGDFICDTYADPDLLFKVADKCQYIGIARDNSGRFYVPSVSNIMSNTPDNCKCGFTPLQYRRMYYYFFKYRQYLN